MYVMMCTHPDICHAVGLVSWYQSNPGQKHWMIVKRILWYLKGTSDYMLWYQVKEDLWLIGYSDVDCRGDIDQSKSISGYAFLLNDSVILWSSKKQSCVALSTMEFEYVACSIVTQDAVWLRNFLQHLKISKQLWNLWQFSMITMLHWLWPKILNIMERPNASRKDITL